jgi:hypothetical protein
MSKPPIAEAAGADAILVKLSSDMSVGASTFGAGGGGGGANGDPFKSMTFCRVFTAFSMIGSTECRILRRLSKS